MERPRRSLRRVVVVLVGGTVLLVVVVVVELEVVVVEVLVGAVVVVVEGLTAGDALDEPDAPDEGLMMLTVVQAPAV